MVVLYHKIFPADAKWNIKKVVEVGRVKELVKEKEVCGSESVEKIATEDLVSSSLVTTVEDFEPDDVVRDVLQALSDITVPTKMHINEKKDRNLVVPIKYASSSRTCYICMGDEQEQLITLKSCGHFVHQDCIKGQIAAGWTGKRISFGFLSCGECRTPIYHKKLSQVLAPHLKLKKEVEEICYSKCLEDDIIDNLEFKLKENNKKTKEECLNILSCFICTKCNKPFSGGRMDCADDNDLDVSTIKCPSCAFDEVEQKDSESDKWRGKCRNHGYKYALYKCDSCCAVATFDCRSNHYCTRCHDQAYSKKDYPCPGLDKCPLGIEHPPNQNAIHGEDRGEFIEGFVIGCYKCFTQSDIELNGFSNESQWEARF
jgi:hypothetical protein